MIVPIIGGDCEAFEAALPTSNSTNRKCTREGADQSIVGKIVCGSAKFRPHFKLTKSKK